MTKQIGLMMTFMFGFFTLQVPAGLSLYWVTSNLLQMLQQWVITDPRFGLTPAPAGAAGGGSVKVKRLPAAEANGGTSVPAIAGPMSASAPDQTKPPKRRRAKRR